MLLDQDLVEELKMEEKTLKQIIVREWQELERREKVDRGSRPLPDLSERTIILVDDGIATGWSIKAAISIVKPLITSLPLSYYPSLLLHLTLVVRLLQLDSTRSLPFLLKFL